MTRTALVFSMISLVACSKDSGAPNATPEPSTTSSALAAAPSSSSSASSSASAPPLVNLHESFEPPAGPHGKFVEVTQDGTHLTPGVCSESFIGVARGTVFPGLPKITLSEGDTASYANVDAIDLVGDALIAYANVPIEHCDPEKAKQTPSASFHKAFEAAPVTWANGTMTAHFDSTDRKVAYFGRLEGTGNVPMHQHDGSWELLFAVQADGLFFVADGASHLGPREVVGVPPGVRHFWTPAPGSKLVAFQLYSPPGPEQRFKKLAAGEAAGAADGSASAPKK